MRFSNASAAEPDRPHTDSENPERNAQRFSNA